MHGKVVPVQGHVRLSNARGRNSPRLNTVLRLHRGAGLAGQISDDTLQKHHDIVRDGSVDERVALESIHHSQAVSDERPQWLTYTRQELAEMLDSLRVLEVFFVRLSVWVSVRQHSNRENLADDGGADLNGSQLHAARPAVRCTPSARFDLTVKAKRAERAPETDFAVLATVSQSPTGGSPACRAW
jgi:hypothetical protein